MPAHCSILQIHHRIPSRRMLRYPFLYVTPSREHFGQAGEQFSGGNVVDGRYEGLILGLVAFEAHIHLSDGGRRRVGVVAAEEHVVRFCESFQHSQRLRARREGGIEVERLGVLPELLRHGRARHVLGRHRRHRRRQIRQHGGGAEGEVGQGAAGVREDHLHVGAGPHGARNDEVDGLPRRLVRVVEHGLRKGSADELRVDGVRRVHENSGTLGVQQLPGGAEVGVSQVMVALVVAGVKNNPVSLQLVEGVDNLNPGRCRVEQGWDSGEKAVPAWVRTRDFESIHIGLTAEGRLFRNGQDLGTRGRDGEEGEGRVLFFVVSLVLFQTPLRGSPARGITTLVLQD